MGCLEGRDSGGLSFFVQMGRRRHVTTIMAEHRRVRQGGKACYYLTSSRRHLMKAMDVMVDRNGRLPTAFTVETKLLAAAGTLAGPPLGAVVKMEEWGCLKEMEAGKVRKHVCLLLRLELADLKLIEDSFFWSALQFRNVPMVHAFGLVVRWFAKDEACWHRLRSSTKNCRVMVYVLVLYVAMKQIMVHTGEPTPNDVLHTLGKFGLQMSTVQVNKMEMAFLEQIRWRTHLVGNPHTGSPDAQLDLVKSECNYDILLKALEGLVDDHGDVQWANVSALSRRLA